MYERAIANVPPATEKRLWKRYIYLWINFAIFEESVAQVRSALRTRAAAVACSRPANCRTSRGRALCTRSASRSFRTSPSRSQRRAPQLANRSLPADARCAQIWLMLAKFEVRRKNVEEARKVLGTAIGKCPKDKLYKGYIELEMQVSLAVAELGGGAHACARACVAGQH